MESEKIFGRRLKELRKEAGLTQTQLAEMLHEVSGKHLTVASISYYETGTNLPALNMLPAFSEILGVSIDSLFGREHPALLEAEPEGVEHPLQRDLERLERKYGGKQNISNNAKGYTETEVADNNLISAEDLKNLLSIARRQQDELKFLKAKFNLVRDMVRELKRM